jgi:hypothetical protein
MSRVERELCLFCTNRATTGEHLFSDGLKRQFKPRDNASRYTTISAKYRAGDGDNIDVERFVRRPHKGVLNATKHYVVCDDCNHVWMSRLEQAAQPLLVPLIRGEKARYFQKKTKNLGAMVCAQDARQRMRL